MIMYHVVYTYRVSQKKGWSSFNGPYRPPEVDKTQKLGEFWKIQEISFPMNTKTPHFCEKTAEKIEVKHGYPPLKYGII